MSAKHELFDVIVIGGSYAGLSAAMALGRSLRETLIIDSGQPCNKQTPHSHNFLTQDGRAPAEIAALARAQVEKYQTIRFLKDAATGAVKTGDGFAIKTKSGESYKTRKLIFASGVKDEMPDIEGFTECWGISVIHCPYCHGYEYREQKTGILANGDHAYHLASLVNNLTGNLTILTNGTAQFQSQELITLKEHDIEIVESTIVEIEHSNGHVNNVVFQNGEKTNFDAIYAAVVSTQHTDIPIELGCEISEQGYIVVDMLQKTNVEGIYACGDNTTPFRSVANAVASGNIAGAAVNKELVEEDFR